MKHNNYRCDKSLIYEKQTGKKCIEFEINNGDEYEVIGFYHTTGLICKPVRLKFISINLGYEELLIIPILGTFFSANVCTQYGRCLTVHKSQAETVITYFPEDCNPYDFINRKLLYTAIT